MKTDFFCTITKIMQHKQLIQKTLFLKDCFKLAQKVN